MKHLLQLTVMLLSAAVLVGCGACGNEISQTVASPSGQFKAVVFHRDCGATTGHNTQVSVIAASAKLPSDGGNTLILDGSVPLKVQWQSDSSLQVSGLGSAKIFKQDSSVAGVSVKYNF